jgi:hypothetical protein
MLLRIADQLLELQGNEIYALVFRENFFSVQLVLQAVYKVVCMHWVDCFYAKKRDRLVH